jgi:methyl-accepting chemotaxis protein
MPPESIPGAEPAGLNLPGLSGPAGKAGQRTASAGFEPPAGQDAAQNRGAWCQAFIWLPGMIRRIRSKRGLNRKHKQELWQGLDRMQRLTRQTEKDILRLGGQVQDFFQAAQGMTEQGSKVVELVSGQTVGETSSRLEHLVGEIRGCFEKCQAEFAKNLELLASARQEVSAASQPLNGFHQMVTGLRMLGVSTRIESARMQGTDEGFHFLAEEVTRLADTILEQTEEMASLLDSLSARLDEALGSISGLGDGLNGGMDNFAEAVGQSLEGLHHWRGQSELGAGRVADNIRQVHADMAEVVSSMQFHDITRQRLEHVHQPLTRLIQGKSDTPPNEVCGLQVTLLEHAGEELGQAVGNMQNSLRGIAGSVRQVARDADLMTRGDSGQEVSFLERLEADLSNIIAIADHTEQALTRLHDLEESVVKTLEQVGSSLSSIDSLSYAIKFVALNAAIKSNRLGREGAALESIAQAIQHQSAEANAATKDLKKVLDYLGKAAESMRKSMVMDTGLDERTANELESLLDSIRKDNQAVNDLLHELEQNGCDLAARLEEGADGIKFHLNIRQGISEVIGCLNQLLERAGCKILKPEGRDRAGLSTQNYTMASERRIHDAWAMGMIPGPQAKPDAKAPGLSKPGRAASDESTLELDDNVDLF